MTSESEKVAANKKNWDIAAKAFRGWCALPMWGPFEVGADDPSLIGPISGKTFLEIGCGSGHSIQYLITRGAKKVFALDVPSTQVAYARKLNEEGIRKGTVEIFESAMEDRVPIKPVDTVFSVYAIGWSVNPEKVFKNIHMYLKPDGRFVWSWEHKMFSDTKLESGRVTITRPYFEETERFFKFESGDGAYETPRMPSTWFNLLKQSGLDVVRFIEAKPYNINEDINKISGTMAGWYDKDKARLVPATIIFECKKKSPL